VQIELLERGKSCGQRRACGLEVILHGWWRLYFVRLRGLQYFCGGERERAVWVVLRLLWKEVHVVAKAF
jgi:hypothetical protein